MLSCSGDSGMDVRAVSCVGWNNTKKATAFPSLALSHSLPSQTDSVALNSSRTYWGLAKWLTSITRACVPTPAHHPGTGAGSSQGQPSRAKEGWGIPYDRAPASTAKSHSSPVVLCVTKQLSPSVYFHNLNTGGRADSPSRHLHHLSPSSLLKS